MDMYEPLITPAGLAVDAGVARIESDRLRLRPVLLVDAEAILEYFTDEIVHYMFPAAAKCIEDVESFINQALVGEKSSTNFQFAVCDKYSGEFLGCCGLHKSKDEAAPEVGIWIKAIAHGKGYGLEAIAALKGWVGSHLHYRYLIYPVDRDNVASRRIAEKLGGVATESYSRNNAAGRMLNIVVYQIPLD